MSTLAWAPYAAPWALAIGVVVFFAYWLVRSYAVVVACLVGMWRLRRWQRVDWRWRYGMWSVGHPGAQAWDWPRHLVIIPNFKESESGLTRTLDSLAAQENAGRLYVVLAMEAREAGCRTKAARLLMRYRNSFGEMFATYHPAGLPGETPGKGSNEAWAAREAWLRLIDTGREQLERFTVTSCDADAVFHARHFEALNYLFLTSADRYRAFWQPAIFNSNNIWDIPSLLRIPDGLSGINRLSNLVMPGSVRFPTSCYSLSWTMLDEVDYWDEEVIPEDWHLYLKCAYTLGDRVHVESLFLPLGNDCVLTDGYWKTLKAHYAQSVRHAWGASDVPYAWRASLNRASPAGLSRRLLLAGAVAKVHALWMAQWYLITLGPHLPLLLTRVGGAGMPGWWTAAPVRIPGPNLRFLSGDVTHPIDLHVTLGITTGLIYFCLFPLLALIVIEYRLRGPRPAHVGLPVAIAQLAVWPLMAVITFFFASLPALHAQLKLAAGRGLVYRVAEKGSRRVAVSVPVLTSEPAPEPIAAGGGGGS
ncbi:MAG: hypothetical protein IT304_05845 [Dehalococcoidia bacterium]|nr:hypothetical protein [Dehalococcoidia bacterium]